MPLVLFALFFATLLGPLGRWFWICDLVANFPLQIAGLTLFTLFAALLRKRFVLASLAAVLFLVNISLVASLYFRNAPAVLAPVNLAAGEEAAPRLRLLLYNLQVMQPLDETGRPQSFLVWLATQAEPFDIVVLQEVRPELAAVLEGLSSIYPQQSYNLSNSFYNPSNGTLVLSRLPVREQKKLPLEVSKKVLEALRLELPDGRDFMLYSFHAPSPTTAQNFAARNAQSAALAEIIAADQNPLKVFLGDLNNTPFSAHFKGFLQRSRLKNSLTGQGLQTSWPSFLPTAALRIPIDHILISEPVIVLERAIGPDFGSDHLPVTATIAFP